MSVTHYLKQFSTWLTKTPIVQFTVRLLFFCSGLLVYMVVMSFMLTLLLLLGLYKLTFGLLSPKQKRQGNVYDMESESEHTKKHFSEHTLPALPKW